MAAQEERVRLLQAVSKSVAWGGIRNVIQNLGEFAFKIARLEGGSEFRALFALVYQGFPEVRVWKDIPTGRN